MANPLPLHSGFHAIPLPSGAHVVALLSPRGVESFIVTLAYGGDIGDFLFSCAVQRATKFATAAEAARAAAALNKGV